MLNNVILQGNLARDVEVRAAGEGSVARFTVCVTRNFKAKDAANYDTDFVSCVAFGKTAEHIAKFYSKGSQIIVTGRIQTGSYTNKDGQKVYTTDVVVDNSYFCGKKGDNPTSGSQGQTLDQITAAPIEPTSDSDLPWMN